MSGLEVFIAAAGVAVTMLVLVAMVLITPRGTVDANAEGDIPEGSSVSAQTEAAPSGRFPAGTQVAGS